MAAPIQVYETTEGTFVIARNFRVTQTSAYPEFRGSFSHRRTLFDVWGRNRLWVRHPSAAHTFGTFEMAAQFLEQHRIELEVN